MLLPEVHLVQRDSDNLLQSPGAVSDMLFSGLGVRFSTMVPEGIHLSAPHILHSWGHGASVSHTNTYQTQNFIRKLSRLSLSLTHTHTHTSFWSIFLIMLFILNSIKLGRYTLYYVPSTLSLLRWKYNLKLQSGVLDLVRKSEWAQLPGPSFLPAFE